jgi:alkylhydroperoxidase family enzyme
MRFPGVLIALAFASNVAVGADAPSSSPRPVPLTRPEMKKYLEDMKSRTPRIPLPELTEADKEKLGEPGTGYEARLRYHYMPASSGRGGFGFGGGFGGRDPEPKMTLTYAFKTELFWIVCRANNCQYCQGHQENKLLRAGLKEDAIAALDGDWSEFTPAQQAAFAFARKITYEPHLIGDADLDKLRKHYRDLQILEMILSIAGNNAINRWKEGAGVPQSASGGGFRAAPGEERPKTKHTYETPTAAKYQSAITKVAPIHHDEATKKPTRLAVCRRPALESPAEVEKALQACRKRKSRLPLVDEADARKVLPADWPAGPLPQWVRLLVNFPSLGKSRILSARAAEEKGDLKPLLKAQVSWIIARQDRAWYALGEAKRRLQKLGVKADKIHELDGDWAAFTPSERALFTLARKLAASPVVLTDDDVAKAVKLVGPRDVVQMISYTTERASFDRITEAARLQLEE